MHTEVVRGQEAGEEPRLEQGEARDVAEVVDVEAYSEVELIELAESYLGDGVDVFQEVDGALEESGGDQTKAMLLLNKIAGRMQPSNAHAQLSVAASWVLNNRRLESIAASLDRGNRKRAEMTDRMLQVVEKLERIAVVLERADAAMDALAEKGIQS